MPVYGLCAAQPGKASSVKSKVKKETKKSGKIKADVESEKTKQEQAEKRPVPVEAKNEDL